jgi:magnesium-transporting ATPase (P-type)
MWNPSSVNLPADAATLFQALNSGPEGISAPDSSSRLAICGHNELGDDRDLPWPRQLATAFNTPFNYLLMALAAIGLISGDIAVVAIILSMIAISGGLRFTQEFQSGRAASRLKRMVHTTATVLRPGCQPGEAPIRMLVPGDVVALAAGDLVPADVVMLSAKDLQVNQASLTGESMPAEKVMVPSEPLQSARGGANPLEIPWLGFMGSAVISGSGHALVLRTGKATHMGSIAGGISARRGETAFDRGVNASSLLLFRFMLVMVPVIFIINGLTKGDWFQALLFGVSVAVGLTPEMLPMIVTANLARGAVAMSARKVVVKYLPAIQNLGGMDILCTDKTGTLTQDRVVLIKHLSINGKMAASSNFGNMLSVLAAGIWLPFLPMLPIHLLVQNLLYDISQIGIPFDRNDEEFLARPRPWRIAELGRFMLVIGPVSSVFDIITFCALLIFIAPMGQHGAAALFQTGWFVEGLLSQTLIIHMIRTSRRPGIDSMASPTLTALTIGVMATGLLIPGSALGAMIGLVPLPWSFFPILGLILAGYIFSVQLVKRWYIARFGAWL